MSPVPSFTESPNLSCVFFVLLNLVKIRGEWMRLHYYTTYWQWVFWVSQDKLCFSTSNCQNNFVLLMSYCRMYVGHNETMTQCDVMTQARLSDVFSEWLGLGIGPVQCSGCAASQCNVKSSLFFTLGWCRLALEKDLYHHNYSNAIMSGNYNRNLSMIYVSVLCRFIWIS